MLCRNTVVLALALGTTVTAQGTKRSPLEGAWRVTSVSFTGADTENIPNPQPGLFIFTRSHYSAVWNPDSATRAPFKDQKATTEEKVAAFDSFIANSGTYRVAGDLLTMRPMIARIPNCADSASIKMHFKRDGQTLWLMQTSTDVNCRYPSAASANGPATVTKVKLVRAE